ncbi:MAG: hypothetical protein ACOC57_00275 [Acidobacteriota bacterium]
MGTLKELIQIVGEKDITYICGDFKANQAGEILGSIKKESILSLQDGKAVRAVEASRAVPLLLEKFFKTGLVIHDVSIKKPSLESVFLKLTGKELRE